MTNIAIVYYSATGHVHQLAHAAAQAAEKAGAEVRLRRIGEVVPGQETADLLWIDRAAWAEHVDATAEIPVAQLDDLEWADAIMIGTPVRYGLPAPKLMEWIDTTTDMAIAGKLHDKPVTAFTSGDGAHAGQETTVLGLYNTFCHWGGVIVPNGITHEVISKRRANGCPYGTASHSHQKQPGTVPADNIAAVEYQARHVIKIAEALNRGLAVS
ncbi:NAD(P)H-dependent oxidoreductase [Streptomyces bacillaris]|uniref:NAD(P)H dehydrogenase n=1 Tax=Streptomyces cavourensis TaxID=67258 RepID=A0AAD0Q6W1_9ACTN|nr:MULTISPECIES: NAD(P)H-dependent oxidoreductase [Streptomyces]NUW23029.1 NAD(P)H dehydrogenase [Streptomyces roseoviolaceus]ATY97378.1 NAD(P)H dehydrogenase [Streptomyces cavourensis]AXI73210.1 NAD(P)H dehydrogenase [Streptomyces cavourensis]MBH0243365.1 NAD(P)H-dependent oxidoreductase [Streptomyces cavourensis]NUV39669.1 NAD(P)H dehydrogenase [Streptomyces sp. CAI-24]